MLQFPHSITHTYNFLGIDFKSIMEIAPQLAEQDDVLRKAKILRGFITLYQQCISSLELCSKPVLAAIHSGCIGAGVNLVTAADVRYCTADAWFQLKEVSAIQIQLITTKASYPESFSLYFDSQKFL